MSEMRPCAPSESSLWTEFLNRSFGYESPQSYAVDFAPLFTSDALTRSRLVWNKNRIVASATLYPVNAIIRDQQVKLGVIGAVATEEGSRGQGISTQVLSELEAAAKREGLQGLVLWSDQHSFYDKQGFRPVGQQQIYVLSPLQAPTQLSDRILNGSAIYGWDWPAVRKHYERHAMRLDRSDAYWHGLEQIKSCTRVQWVDAKGEVLAYLGFDRGKDLKGIIHEWGGDTEALYALVWVVLQNRPELLWLTHPRIDDPIRDLLPTEACAVDGSMGLFKSLDPTLSASDLRDLWFWGLDSL